MARVPTLLIALAVAAIPASQAQGEAPADVLTQALLEALAREGATSEEAKAAVDGYLQGSGTQWNEAVLVFETWQAAGLTMPNDCGTQSIDPDSCIEVVVARVLPILTGASPVCLRAHLGWPADMTTIQPYRQGGVLYVPLFTGYVYDQNSQTFGQGYYVASVSLQASCSMVVG